MNRPRPGRYCFVCGQDITILAISMRGEGEDYMAAMQRMTSSGVDDQCQRLRQQAAVDYIRACDHVREMASMGATMSSKLPHGGMLAVAIDAIERADARCVALKMWPADRRAPRGEQ